MHAHTQARASPIFRVACNASPCPPPCSVPRFSSSLVQVLVYCWGGGSRSARILAFLLVALHSFVAEEAIKQVCRAPGTNRMVTPEQLQALLA
eukprot:1147362-Pelagomonas_calceolata.AAC.11